MTSRSWLRDVRQLLDALGVEGEFEQGRKHVRVSLRRGDRVGTLHISHSPSDRKAIRRVERDIRHIMGLVHSAQEG